MTKTPIPITITKLEMTAKPTGLRPKLRREHDNGRVVLLKVKQPPVHFYRYLYQTVGRDHVWVERTRMSDENLAAIVRDENVDIYVSIAKARRPVTPNSTSAKCRTPNSPISASSPTTSAAAWAAFS
jgi:hypothetical protein